ncbi:MAG: 1-aminocyclopropane-1-carboxylate deaminase/D-cysteine desulfhydrase [bacterium]
MSRDSLALSRNERAPLLFHHYPSLATTIPWTPLGDFATPVSRLSSFEKTLGVKGLWLKRDDLSGKLYGGNKVRTLEFVLAQAKEQQARVVASYSALGSNWPLACTIYARQQGFESEVFFLPYPMDDIKKKNLEMTRQLAAHIYCARSLFTFPFLLWAKLASARRQTRVFLTPPGGTSPTTALAFVNAILELKQQCDQEELPVPDVIVCPLGSGGTAAGLSVGLNLIGWPTTLIAVRVVNQVVANAFTLGRLVRRTTKLLQQHGIALSPKQNYRIEHDYFGKGYGKPLPLAQKHARSMEEQEGIALDATYTSKAFAALVELAKRSRFRQKKILFWHTLNSRPLALGHMPPPLSTVKREK